MPETMIPNYLPDGKRDLSVDTFPPGGLTSIEEIDSFDVVRAEFLSSVFKAKLTVNSGRLRFNSACVRMIPDTEYVQMLFDGNAKRVALLPCGKYDKDSVKWSNIKSGKPQSRDILAQMLCSKLYEFMDWIMMDRYKIMAVYQVLGGREIIIFNLMEYERVVSEQIILPDGRQKKKMNKFYPPNWRDSFGDPYSVHRSSYSVNLDDYYLLSNREPERAPGSPMIEGQAPNPTDIITHRYYIPDEQEAARTAGKEAMNALDV